jgi:hypothetical protein
MRLTAIGHHRVKLNRIVTDTSICDIVMPAGKGGSCAPRIMLSPSKTTPHRRKCGAQRSRPSPAKVAPPSEARRAANRAAETRYRNRRSLAAQTPV